MLTVASDSTSGTLPSEDAADVYEVAARLMRVGAQNDSSLWFSFADSTYPRPTDIPDILDPDYTGPKKTAPINPKFKAAPLAVAVAIYPTGVGKLSLPSTVPLAWTRGLQPDGTWSKTLAPYGDWGGYVVFLGGNVTTFKGGIKGGLVKFGTNEPTSNILEALPPGSRISEFVPPKP